MLSPLPLSTRAATAPLLEPLEPRCHLSAAAKHRGAHGHRAPVIAAASPRVKDDPSPIIGTAIIAAPPAGRTFQLLVGSFNGSAGPALAAALESAGPNVETRVTIAWGDGTSSQGLLQQDADGNFDVFAVHKYVAPGTFNIGVVVTQGPPPTAATAPSIFSTHILSLLYSTAIVH
jgi:hypothetical protein